ncbi:MAG: extracellular solute-binding protein, partial [Niameybacter sp.]
MSKRLRVSTVLMASIMFVSATLTGCSGGDTAVDTNKETGAVGEDIAVDKKDEKPTNLIWYTVANEPPTDLEKVQAALNEYTLEKINTTIDITTMSYADYNEKMPVMINSGEAFDICFTSSGDNPYVLNASRGAFVDLTPYLENEGKEMYDAIDEKFWEGITVDGQIFAVPTQKELPWAPSL